MKLYKLERLKAHWGGHHNGFIIAARTQPGARMLARKRTEDYDDCDWMSVIDVVCTMIASDSIYEKEQVVQEDFDAG